MNSSFKDKLETADHLFFCNQFFDGIKLHHSTIVVVRDDLIAAVFYEETIGNLAKYNLKHCDLLAPTFVDLQVNGAGGYQFNNKTDAECLFEMANSLQKLGTGYFLPTLITDQKEKIISAASSVKQVQNSGFNSIAGLHLEGPHLDPQKAGAHLPEYIVQMTSSDLETYLNLKDELGILKLTIAPENVSLEQVQVLANAGIYLALGHANCSFETASTYFAAGVCGVTHLFNAMSGLNHREPGLVGAALSRADLNIGVIGDGYHIHDVSLKVALDASQKRSNPFFVSDAMAPLGTDLQSFALNDRIILREGDRLTLPDGTLAGANMDLAHMVKRNVDVGICELEQALRMVTTSPSNAAGLPYATARLEAEGSANFNIFTEELDLVQVWRNGIAVDT